MNLGSQHLSARRRQEPFPSRIAWKRALDYVMYAVGMLQWLALLPQISAIYLHGQTQGISISTWSILAGVNVLWFFYGLAHRDKVVATANFLMMSGDLAIVLGVLAR